MTVTVYGASDDLIEIEGDVRAEFYYQELDENGDVLAFSDGTVLRVAYTAAGVWRISPVANPFVGPTITQAPEDDEDNYSDVAKVPGEIKWVVHGIGVARG